MARLRPFIAVFVAAMCLLAGWWGHRAWQRSRIATEFESAWHTFQEQGSTRPAQAFARSYAADAEFGRHAQLLRGAVVLRSGDPAGAYRILSGVDPVPALRPHLLLLMGECLYRQGDLVEAERAFRQAARENPADPQPHRCLALVYHDIGAMVAAVGELYQVIQLDPDDYRAYSLVAEVEYQDFVRPKETVEILQKALELNPPAEEIPALRRRLAGAQLSLHDYTAALETLKPLDEDALGLVLQAECLWSLGQKDQARKLLARSRELDPANDKAPLLEAGWQLEARNGKAAADLLVPLVKKDPHNTTLRYKLATAYRLQGDSAASEAELKSMQKSDQLRKKLQGLYEKAMKDPLDLESRETIVAVLEELNLARLAEVWRRAARSVRQAKALQVEPSPSS